MKSQIKKGLTLCMNVSPLYFVAAMISLLAVRESLLQGLQ